jgi:hypothetical protein
MLLPGDKAMGLQETRIESLPFVTAELNYLAPTSGKPRTYAFDPPPGEPKSTNLPEPHQVPVFDGRAVAKSFSLDREGFELVRHPTAVKNFYDEAEIKRVYYPAVEAFMRAALGADRVFIFDHTVRKRVEGAADIRGAGPRQPATRVHVDQTVTSGQNRVREHLPTEAEELLKGRVQVINLWRPIRGPVRDAPLAMADGTTVTPDDLVASDLIYPNRSGETYSVKYNPNHRWFYFPEMTADEVLLLKCYDSATDGRTRFGPHTAFVDPTTPPDTPPRESIEIRALVFHRA